MGGAVGAAIEFVVGIFIIAATLVFSAPLFEIMNQMAINTGVDQNPTFQFCMSSIDYVLLPVGIAMAIHAIARSGGIETTGIWR